MNKIKPHFNAGEKMKTGCPMNIVTLIPHQKELSKGYAKKLSGKAKLRLKIIDWYNRSSSFKSASGKKDANLTSAVILESNAPTSIGGTADSRNTESPDLKKNQGDRNASDGNGKSRNRRGNKADQAEKSCILSQENTTDPLTVLRR